MISANEIKPDTPVVCSNNRPFAKVDHMEGNQIIKLKRDKNGQHHFIPLSWVTKVDETVHVGIPGDRAMKEWATTPKAFLGDFSGVASKRPAEPTEKAAIDRATNEGMQNAPGMPNPEDYPGVH